MSTIKANDIQNASGGIPTVKGQKLIPTAWVNFNGTGVVAIRDSEGVSSIGDVATGKYTINFATAMANSDYTVVSSAGDTSGTTIVAAAINTTTVNGCNLVVFATGAQTALDRDLVTAVVMGGQS